MPDLPPDQRVRTTTRSWAAESEAAESVDGCQRPKTPPAYRFSNGREFKPGQDFYDTKPRND